MLLYVSSAIHLLFFQRSNSPNDCFKLCSTFLFFFQTIHTYTREIRLKNLGHAVTDEERKGWLIKGFDSRGSNYSLSLAQYPPVLDRTETQNQIIPSLRDLKTVTLTRVRLLTAFATLLKND